MSYVRRTSGKDRDAHLKSRYRLTSSDYDLLFEAQERKCAICRKVSESRLHVDHDHITGLVRGLLCAKCNQGIGMFQDNVDYLKYAIRYLQGRNCGTMTPDAQNGLCPHCSGA